MNPFMANKRPKGRYIKGAIEHEMAIGALASKDVVATLLDEVTTERTRVNSVKATYSLREATADEGPIVVGLAHSDYTGAEIEAFIENTGSWGEGDLVAQEVARRKIKIVGVFDFSGVVNELNDGLPIYTRLGWVLTTGQTLRTWAYNQDESSPITTGADLMMLGHANLRVGV